MIPTFIKNFFAKKSVRISLVILAAFWALAAIIFYLFYQAAYAHLLNNDPRIMQNRSEVAVNYAPLKIAVGDELALTELTDYLIEVKKYIRIEV